MVKQTKQVKQTKRVKQEEAEVEVEKPRRAGFFRRLVGILILVVLGAGGAFVWAFYQDHQEWPWDNPEKAKSFLFSRKDGAEVFLLDRSEDAELLLAEGKKGASAFFEQLTQEKDDVEEWFKKQEIVLPSRQDLKDMASRYLAPSPTSDRKEEPTREKPKPVAKPKPVEKPKPKLVAKLKPVEKPKPVAKPKPKPVPKPEPVAKPEVGMVVAMAPVEKPKPIVKPKPAPKRKSTVEAKGRDLLREGVKHWRVSTIALQAGNRAKEQKELAASKKLFDKALEHLSEALEKNPDNSDLQNRVVDCNRFRYDCLKRTIVNLK